MIDTGDDDVPLEALVILGDDPYCQVAGRLENERGAALKNLKGIEARDAIKEQEMVEYHDRNNWEIDFANEKARKVVKAITSEFLGM